MMVLVSAHPGALLRPGIPTPPAAPTLSHPHASDRRRRFRQELARRWDLLQLEEERKPTGRRS